MCEDAVAQTSLYCTLTLHKHIYHGATAVKLVCCRHHLLLRPGSHPIPSSSAQQYTRMDNIPRDFIFNTIARTSYNYKHPFSKLSSLWGMLSEEVEGLKTEVTVKFNTKTKSLMLRTFPYKDFDQYFSPGSKLTKYVTTKSVIIDPGRAPGFLFINEAQFHTILELTQVTYHSQRLEISNISSKRPARDILRSIKGNFGTIEISDAKQHSHYIHELLSNVLPLSPLSVLEIFDSDLRTATLDLIIDHISNFPNARISIHGNNIRLTVAHILKIVKKWIQRPFVLMFQCEFPRGVRSLDDLQPLLKDYFTGSGAMLGQVGTWNSIVLDQHGIVIVLQMPKDEETQ
uniref:FTH domain-containing protein n=1 Tax=Steinernema glaseri TaxID=37863 RepID=A0A1I8AMI2_9BILA